MPNPKWRVDLRQVKGVIEQETKPLLQHLGYHVVEYQFRLYGPESLLSDSIWKTMEENDTVEVARLTQNACDDREERFDVKLCVDVTAQAAQDETREEKDNLSVMVSGYDDLADFAVKKIVGLGFKKLQVHTWSWKHALSRRYFNDEELKDKVTIHYLDNYLDMVGF
jgi:hypothetical protein